MYNSVESMYNSIENWRHLCDGPYIHKYDSSEKGFFEQIKCFVLKIFDLVKR